MTTGRAFFISAVHNARLIPLPPFVPFGCLWNPKSFPQVFLPVQTGPKVQLVQARAIKKRFLAHRYARVVKKIYVTVLPLAQRWLLPLPQAMNLTSYHAGNTLLVLDNLGRLLRVLFVLFCLDSRHVSFSCVAGGWLFYEDLIIILLNNQYAH